MAVLKGQMIKVYISCGLAHIKKPRQLKNGADLNKVT